MRSIARGLLTAPALVLFSTAAALAQGFAGGEASTVSGSTGSGARALGMGGAFIGIADDATAASWNPAGLCVLERPEVSVVYQPLARYGTETPTTIDSQYSPPTNPNPGFVQVAGPRSIMERSHALDFASGTYPFRLGGVKLVPQLSYQRVFDMGQDFTWTRTFDTTQDGVTSRRTVERDIEASGGIDVVSGSLGVSFTTRVYLGLAMNFWRNGQEVTRVINVQRSSGTTVTTQTFDEDYSGRSFHVGLLAKPTERVRVGLVYKSGFDLDQTGLRVTKSDSIPGGIEELRYSGTISWPKTFGAGLAFQPTDALTLAADYTKTSWSEAILDPDGTTPSSYWPTGGGSPDAAESAFNPHQADGVQVRLGLEYVLTKPGFAGLTVVPLRVGWFRDQQLFKQLPGVDTVAHQGFTMGFGLVWSSLSLDLAYVYTRGPGLQNEVDGVPPGSTTRIVRVQDGEETYRSHRVYVSTTVRF